MPQYSFEQIAINSTEKKKPVEADKDTYLGLEHLDSGCLRVTRRGAEVAPIGDKLVMRKGDVLFGRRRAYQKKVAIAPFDGIFSAHGMVLRPHTEVITEKFFPFFIASDYFLDAAIKISVGSLSPTINWRDLKELTFNIPPLEEQDALAEELWAFEAVKEAYSGLMVATDALVKSQFIEMFGDADEVELGSLCDLINGDRSSHYPKGSDFVESGIPFINAGHIQSNDIDFTSMDYISNEKYDDLRSGKLKENDIVYCLRGSLGKHCLIKRIPGAVASSLVIIRTDSQKLLAL